MCVIMYLHSSGNVAHLTHSVAVEYTLYTNTVVSHKCVLFIMYKETDTSIQQVLQGVMVVNAYQVPLYNTCHPCRGFALLVS